MGAQSKQVWEAPVLIVIDVAEQTLGSTGLISDGITQS